VSAAVYMYFFFKKDEHVFPSGVFCPLPEAIRIMFYSSTSMLSHPLLYKIVHSPLASFPRAGLSQGVLSAELASEDWNKIVCTIGMECS
jgi:hypothetical protein